MERQARASASHCGARRFAYNFELALVKKRLDGLNAGEDVSVPWSLPALRRKWNQAKHEVAPWWPENSKEAYSAGLADLARGFDAFWASKRGERKGPRVRFPRFKGRGRRRESYRYTTGSFRVSGRCRVQLPRVGHVRTHEPTGKLAAKLTAGKARVLSMTVCREGGRPVNRSARMRDSERRVARLHAHATYVRRDVSAGGLAGVSSSGRSQRPPRSSRREPTRPSGPTRSAGASHDPW